jgi:hypothetical protein
MSVNRFLPHVLVLPEDDANRQLANGFLLDPLLVTRSIQVLPVAGGWIKLLACFESDHLSEMNIYPDRFMVLLIDFDGQQNRLEQAQAVIPFNLKDRVFVLGVWTEPERLRAILGSYETIGRAIAQACREETIAIWDHELLRHNANDFGRLRRHVRPILFQ